MTASFGERYAVVYDILYSDKDYRAESAYVLRSLKAHTASLSSILEFGIGTGLHAQEIAKSGITVAGIDRSEGMIKKARERLGPDVQLVCGDIESTAVPIVCDAVIAIFHVASYLTDNASFINMIRNAKRHLRSGGVLLFDFWYGPAVLSQRPESRIKETSNAEYEVTRFARTDLDVNRNVAIVNYVTFVHDVRLNTTFRTRETHPMRYYFLPELDIMLNSGGFQLSSVEEWMTGAPLSSASWNGFVVARAT